MTKESTSLFRRFIEQVKTHIRSKEAQTLVGEELTNHLQESSEAFQRAGHTREEAERKAVAQMGSPSALGRKMHQLHRPKVDWGLMAAFLLIVGISHLPMYTLSSTFHWIFSNKLVFSSVSIVLVIGLLFFDYRKLNRFGSGLYIAAILIMLAVIVFGDVVKGRSFLLVGRFTVDFFMTMPLFYFAWAYMLNRVEYSDTLAKKALLFALFWLPIMLYVWNSYFMLACMYFCLVMAMVYCSAWRRRFKLQFAAINLLAVVLFAFVFYLRASAHIQERFAALLNLGADEPYIGYPIAVAREMIAQASWFGQGHASGTLMLGDAHTDLIFPYLVHTFGWLFGLVVLSALLFIGLRMMSTVKKTADSYGRLLVVGGVTLFSVSFIWNVGMSVGLLPWVGVSLPMISYGGAQTVMYSTIIGLILSVHRRKDILLPDVK